MPTRFLSDADREALSTWPRDIARSDLVAYFDLDPSDVRWVRQHRTQTNQLALALQLTALPFLGFLPAPTDAPPEVVSYIGEQIGVPSNAIGNYTTTGERDLQRHTAAVVRHLGWSPCGPGEWKLLGDWLVERALEHDTPSVLFRQALSHLRAERIVRPGVDRLMRAVATARVTASEEIYRRVEPLLTPDAKGQLDSLIELDPAKGTSPLVWLNTGASSVSVAAIREEIAKLAHLRERNVQYLNTSVLTSDRRRQMAQVARRSTPSALRRMRPERRYPLLLSALTEAYRDITDEIVLLFDQALSNIDSRARKLVREEQIQSANANTERLQLFDTILDVALDPARDDAAVGRWIRALGTDRLTVARRPPAERSQMRDGGHLAHLEARYSQVRSFGPHVLDALGFQSSIEPSDVYAGTVLLQRLNATNQRHVPQDAPTGFVPARWQPYLAQALTGQDPTAFRHYWELAVLYALRGGLRSGEIWVRGSRRYANPATYLIDNDEWHKVRNEALTESGCAASFGEQLSSISADTTRLLSDLESMLTQPRSPVTLDDQGQLRLKRLTAERVDPAATQLGEALAARLPSVPLSELLIEVDRATNFTRHLTHAAGANPRHSELDHRRNLYAALLAQACNFGISRMAELCGISRNTLTWVTRWYLREETLRAANAAIVNIHHRHPLAQVWGGGTLSSSDGLRFPIRGRSITARTLPRYFVDQGGTSYTHVSDQHTTYGTRIVVTTDRDATYVLDEILGNATDLPIAEHTTDTHGQTLLTFALFDLVGLRLSPRIAKLAQQRLWRPHPPSYYQPWPLAGPLLAHPVQIHVIEQHWDDLLRLGRSVKSGHVSASLLITRLQAGSRQHPLAKALIEYGKLQRTNHALRWFTDEAFRRRISRQLNRGESLNGLRRYLFFANRGEIIHQRQEDQTTQAHCHTLLTNASILWTTLYLGHAVTAHRNEGHHIEEHHLAHISPARFKHINPYGTYTFNVQDILQQCRHRPLNPLPTH